MDIGIIGLGVMGTNLIQNIISRSYKASIYNRTAQKAKDFESQISNSNILKAYEKLEDFVHSLNRPRKIIILVQSGNPVDNLCDELSKLLEKDDIVMDFGNSFYKDTIARNLKYCNNFRFMGCGLSGGEEGARNGPSIMVGGNFEAWKCVEGILKDISAVYTEKEENFKCCAYIGENGAGHFVKMVHNGIEYGDMAIIAETYEILKRSGSNSEDIASLFENFSDSVELKGYLMEIIVKILRHKIKENQFTVDLIDDRAKNKGTGVWSVIAAMESNQPCTLITSSVFARMLSSDQIKRHGFSSLVLQKEFKNINIDFKDLKSAMILSKAVSYVQGLQLIQKMSEIHDWKIDLKNTCNIWKNGCIIRGDFLKTAAEFTKNMMFEKSPIFVKIYNDHIEGLRKIVGICISNRIPAIAYTNCLLYLDFLATNRCNGSIIQAMRDYFGAHMVKIIDEIEERHIEWSSNSSNIK